MSANENEVSSKAAVETVQMDDGRSVDFAGKRRMIKESFIDEEKETFAVRFDFRNGKSITTTPPQSLYLKFAAHGLEQKYGDETAGETDVDDMYLAVEELDSRIQKGEWSTKREGGGMGGTSVLLRALVELSGKSIESLKEFLKGKTQAEKLALRNSPRVKPIVERLEAEKLTKGAKVDTDALLAELG